MKDYSTKEVQDNSLFGFTVKINDKKEPVHEDYLPVLKILGSKVELVDFTYEDKKKDRKTKTPLHIHGVFKCPKQPYFKSLLPKGIHLCVERIYDIDGWNRYSMKNSNQYNLQEKIDNKVYLF